MAACPACGATVSPGDRFCASCGAPLDPDGREERKVVTVLFCDLVGFTGGAERLDPEDVRATLQPYATRLRAVLEGFGGTVEKFVGDAVMALFGAPVAREDDPERAVRAALAIRDAVAELNESGPPIELHVRIGINTGEALVTLGARPSEGQGMAAGDVVNTASRLEQAAPVDGILVGETTHRATRHAIAYAAAEPVAAKGKASPVAVWNVLGPLESREDVVSAAGAPLIGRDDELELLRSAFTRTTREGAPQLVTLVGVPGIGKSRLVAELASIVDAEPESVFWRQGRSLPYGDGVTFWALAEMARAQAGILHTDGPAAAAEKLAQAVAALVADEAEGRWVETQMRPLVGLDADRSSGGRDAEFAAWRRFFEAMAELRPLVLVFEDLHWADDALLDFVDELVDRIAGVPLLVVATTRPELFERRPSWGGGKRNAVTVALAPLEDTETAELLGVLLDETALPVESRAELLVLVGGVPLCAEEYVRMLADRGFLRRGRLSGELPLPETVQGIIAARLDALPASEKAVVQAASVIGRSFWVGGLAAVATLPPSELDEHLVALERKEFVRRERRSSVASERQYSFSHVLVRDVAYAQIPRGERAEKHRLAAEWIEGLAPERTDDRSEMLAHHYSAALEFARAARQPADELAARARLAFREAGDRAAALYAFAAAARFYASALELSPDSDPELELRYGDALLRAGGEGAEIVAAARDRLLAAGNPGAAAEAQVILAERAWGEGSHEEAAEGFGRAVALVDALDSSPAKAYVLSRVTAFLMADNQQEEAIEAGSRTIAMAETLGLDELKAFTLTAVGVAKTSIGDERGLQDLAESLDLAVRNGAPDHVVRSHFNLGSTYANLGDLERAFEHYTEGSDLANRLGDPRPIRWFAAEALYERWWRGDWDDALAASRALREELGDDAGWVALDAGIVCAAILTARGLLDDARDEVERALDFARAAESPQALVPALASAARLSFAAGDEAGARERLLELLESWRESSFMPGFWVADVAVVAAGLGEDAAFADAAEHVRAPTRWLDAATAYVQGRFDDAADLYERIGSRPDEAHARLRSGTDASVESARAFYQSVGVSPPASLRLR
jgi:class 3 adenylate cyclase/tetratricopeptide (TPR) repeat protein